MGWRSLPPMTALRAFLAFHETGNMSAAGRSLNVSHAAISQQIKALEAELGLTLLDRRGRQTHLTAAGQQLAEATARGFGEMERVVEELTAGDSTRPLQISVTPSFAAAWLMPRLADFRSKHPDVALMIDPSADLKPLEPGGIDVALRYGDGIWPGLAVRLLVPSPVVLVAASDLVPKTPDLQPEDLLGLPWLQELGTHEASKWLRQRGVMSDPALGMSSMPGNLMLEALRLGQGVGVCARALIEPDIQAGRLRVLFEEDESTERAKGYHMVTRPGVQRPPLKIFANWLVRQSGQ
ncbi:LysR family transcriptional regulator [Phaeobacter sp. CNT1-3]|nr:LysR family transcriptional regulator [Phaeobacter sp. CNT1-3]